MSMWTAIIVIVGIYCITELIKARYRARHGITTDAMGNERPVEQENTELRREIEDLRERLKVLERIATDDREAKRLTAEIEKLRDEEE